MSRFYLKIILPSIISILLFILTIFLVIIPHFQQSIMNGKREMIKELTNSAWSILSKYESDERNGLLSREEAQKTAVSRIQYLRYGDENKDYFWITDMEPAMIIHPYRPDLNGKSLTNFSDPHGKKLFVEFVNTVKESEHGYVDYMWQWKDDSLHVVPKLSYVKLFKPWGWVIGTGIYIEDVKKEIDALTDKLLLISTGISILIAFLLLFISQQSLKIERQRIKAQKELHESKEKYKTLVEAATEGIIMLIDGKISFINNMTSKMSGYKNSELINLSLNEIISENNNKDIISTFSKKIVKEGQYEINLRKKNGGFLEVLATSSTSMLFDKAVNIIIIKDITIDRSSNLSTVDIQKLVSTLNIGFFRVSIDNKGRFISANETAKRIFGFGSSGDMMESNILDMPANSDDRKNLRSILLTNGFIKNKVLKIRRKNGELAAVSLTLVLLNNEDSDIMICDGTIEDITLQENLKEESANFIAQLKSNNFLIEQPVKEFVTPLNTLDSEAAINDAVQILSKRKTDCLLLTRKEKDYIGIITNNDIQKRVLSLNLQLDNPAYLIMSSPVVYLNENNSIGEAVKICEEKNINHPVVKNGTGAASGVLRMTDIYRALKDSLSFYISNINKAETNDDLRQQYRQLQQFIKPLIKSEISVKHITNITSSFSDAALKRIIELTIKDIGEPPGSFSFICMGSEGRKEETLFTDQDNAIIYDDIINGEDESVKDYFNKLGENVCDSLNYIGYSFCKGNIMAKNPQYCQPVSIWEKYFASWITTPEPQNLLDATIFFDFRNAYGEEEFAQRLRCTIDNLIKQNPSFLYHLAHNTYNIKPAQFTSGKIISDKTAESVDMKNAVNPIVMFARAYSLANNITCTNTIERLYAMKYKNIINETDAEEIIYAYNFLMKLRFKNQIILSENNLPLSNILTSKNLIDIELSILKKVLALIPQYQNKIGVDFRLAT